MKFTTPCFVRVEDVEKRKKLVEWLEGQIGYRYCVGCFNARSAIDSPLIPYVLVSTRAETGWVECFAQRPDEGIDCSTNIDLFKALAAMNDENAYMQYFVYRNKGYLSKILGGWWLCTEQRWIDWAKPRYSNLKVFARKATSEEIIEHFNTTHS